MPAVISSLQSRLPYCLVKTLEGAGHMAPITHAKTTAAHIQSFLKNHPV
jgi:pimeloyl-ACP methyl ester carboxylesterase